MLNKIKAFWKNDYLMPVMFYVISILELLSGDNIVSAIFLTGGCIAALLVQIKHILINNKTGEQY